MEKVREWGADMERGGGRANLRGEKNRVNGDSGC